MSKLPSETDIITIIRDDPAFASLFAANALPSFGYRMPKPRKPRNPKKAAQKSQRLARKANRR